VNEHCQSRTAQLDVELLASSRRPPRRHPTRRNARKIGSPGSGEFLAHGTRPRHRVNQRANNKAGCSAGLLSLSKEFASLLTRTHIANMQVRGSFLCG
jgi:hypothetical protein